MPLLGTGNDLDVALASQWAQLWEGPSWILPQSFGGISNQTDAAMTLLLDSQIRAAYGERAVFAPEAALEAAVHDSCSLWPSNGALSALTF